MIRKVACCALCVLIYICLARLSFAQTDTLRVFYPIGEYSINQQKSRIDSFVQHTKPVKNLHIIGYADFLGSVSSNKVLSKNRAVTVKQYLLRADTTFEITTEAKGEVDAGGNPQNASGQPFNRRVDIIYSKLQAEQKTNTADSAAQPVDTITQKPVAETQAQPKQSEAAAEQNVYKRLDQLSNLQVGESLSFKELTFKPGRHYLNRKAIPYLQTLLGLMKKHENLQIEIQGHICCDYQNRDGYDFDTKEFNLSVNRAKFIYDYLVGKGIDASRMRYKGFGNTRPKNFPERTEQDQAENRRVVIMVTAR